MNNDYQSGEKPYHYKWDLDFQLETCIQEYEEDREKYWNDETLIDSSTKQFLYGQVEHFTKAILKATDRLVASKDIPNEYTEIVKEREAFLDEIQSNRKLNDLLRKKGISLTLQLDYSLSKSRPPKDTNLSLMWERLFINLSLDAVEKITEGAKRALEIWSLLLENEPSPAVVSFLRHVSKCYVWGFDSECVIMCRGVLDSAFRDAVPDEQCEKKFKRQNDYEDFGLAKRITVAEKMKKIDERIKNLAFKVKECGDKALHNDPETARAALQTIRDTVTVLTKLLV